MDYLFKTSALLLIMYLGYVLFLKKETFFSHNRWFLFFGIIASILVPLIEIPVYVTIQETGISTIPVELLYQPNQIVEQDQPFDWLTLLSYIYATGVAVFFIQFLFQFGSLLLLLAKHSKNKDGIYTYVIVKSKILPFSFFKWIVYNPKLFSDDELQLILNHEKVHVRQWHSLDIIVSRLTCVAFWFNPLVWLYHKHIQQNLEYIADRETQNLSQSTAHYQELLLKTSLSNYKYKLAPNFYNSLIKKRIVMLQKRQSKSINRWKSILVLPLFALFLMSFNTKEIFVEIPKAPTEYAYQLSNTIEIYFNEKTTDKSLADIKEKLKAADVTMTIKDKKRNADGILTSISLNFKTENSATSYWAEDKNGIKPFYFKKTQDGTMSVGAAEMIEVVEEPEVIEIIEVEEEPIIEIIEEEDEENGNPKSETIISLKNITGNKANYTYKIKADSVRYVTGKKVYAPTLKDTVVIGHYIKSSKNIPKSSVKVRGKGYTIKTDSTNYKSVIRLRNVDDKDPIYIINGKTASKKDIKKLNPHKIAEVNVIKDDKAIKLYGKRAKDGVIKITTKDHKNKGTWHIKTSDKDSSKHKYSIGISKIEHIPSYSLKEAEYFIKSTDKPLIIINGEVLGNIKTSKLDPKVIKEVSIIKGDKATELYGDKGKNGAVIIFTNSEYDRQNSQRAQNVRAEISSIGFIEEHRKDEAMSLYFISKTTSDAMINKHVNQLKSDGITAKISKLKRNRSGEIVKIKISLKDNDGNSSSSTFENTNGIPTINFGKQGNTLVVSSKKF